MNGKVMTREIEIIEFVSNQYSMACIFNTVSLDLSAGITDLFGGGFIRGGGRLLENLP